MQNTYLTNIKCPKCGRLLRTSDLTNYSFVCEKCDENFYSCEIINFTASDTFFIAIDMSNAVFKEKESDLQIIANKHKCASIIYDKLCGTVYCTWQHHIPHNYIIQSFVTDLQKIM